MGIRGTRISERKDFFSEVSLYRGAEEGAASKGVGPKEADFI